MITDRSTGKSRGYGFVSWILIFLRVYLFYDLLFVCYEFVIYFMTFDFFSNGIKSMFRGPIFLSFSLFHILNNSKIILVLN